MKLNHQHFLLVPDFSDWPVSDVHRQPVFILIDGIVNVLQSLGLEGSQGEVEGFMASLPRTPRSEQLICDAKAYLKIRQIKVAALSEKQKLIVMSSLNRD